MSNTLYVVTDSILHGPITDKLGANGWTSAAFNTKDSGVRVVRRDGSPAIFLLIDTEAGYYRPDVVAALRQLSRGLAAVHVLAPAVVQHFVHKLETSAPMYDVLNRLAREPVVVQNPFMFEMSPSDGKTAAERLRLRAFMSSVPYGGTTDFGFIDRQGRIDRQVRNSMPLNTGDPVYVRDGAPLVFHHRSFFRQFADAQGWPANEANFQRDIIFDDGLSDAEALCFANLTMTFPTKSPDGASEKLIAALVRYMHSAYGEVVTAEQVKEIWQANRDEWDGIVGAVENHGFNIPRLQSETDADKLHYFMHLIVSNFTSIVGSALRDLPGIRYVGLPLLLRNGLCGMYGKRPDGSYGILLTLADVKENPAVSMVDAMYDRLLAFSAAQEVARENERSGESVLA